MNGFEEATKAAQQIGYPVVLKAVSVELTHKSDLGVVKLGIDSPQALRRAYDEIIVKLEHAKLRAKGMLVSKQVAGGVELVLGLHRDPEMGLVAMVGSGGILLELTRDVAFVDVPVCRQAALAALRRTRASTLLGGYRSAPAHDLEHVVDALVALGYIAADFGELVDSIDINPFLSLPAGQDPMALDALVVLRNPEKKAL